jgi:hypothetical protein
MPNTLRVFLHGTICLIEQATFYRGIFIGMDEHRVAAGNFLTERTIPRGVFLNLDGVEQGSDTLNRDKNIIADVSRLDETALEVYRYAEIKLPKPGTLYSVRTGTWTIDNIAGAFLGGRQYGSYSDVQVFEYNVPDTTKVRLAGGSFVPWFWSQPDFPDGQTPIDQYFSLHIFNEPETAPADDSHFTEEFNRGCRILEVDLRMTAPLPVPPLTSAPLGILEEETMSLEMRVQPVVDLLARIPRPPFDAIGDKHYCGSIAGSLVSR